MCIRETKSLQRPNKCRGFSTVYQLLRPPRMLLILKLLFELFSCTQMTLKSFSLPENYHGIGHWHVSQKQSIVLKVAEAFWQKKKKKVKVDWGLYCGGCRRPCSVGWKFLCLVSGMPFWPVSDLFMWMQNKGPHYALLFCVCLCVFVCFKAALSHILIW